MSAGKGFIRTVRGDIPPGELGYCHAHEHIMVRSGGPYEAWNPLLCIDDYACSLSELERFRSAGGRALVDAQPVGAGRKCRDLLRLSEESGVHIIASTGFHMRAFYPERSAVFSLEEEEAEELFVRELTVGMSDGMDPDFDAERTGIRAGLIKTALPAPEMLPPYRNLFSGALRAALRTGAPVMVHTEKHADIAGFLDEAENCGLAPEKIILCHLDRTCGDPQVAVDAAKRGAYLDYDTVGRYKYHDDAAECALIRGLLDAGCGDRLLLGLDTTRARLACYGGEPGLTFILERFSGIAAGFGIPEEAFEDFMISNPANAFRFGKQKGEAV